MRQLLQVLQTTPRAITLYQDLGRRLAELEQFSDSERAYTSTVEMLPQESESHTVLAGIREQQGRWPEAIVQWEQVARIRDLEPTGLLKLAAAQIHERKWDAAKETLRRLSQKTWPERFGDVTTQIGTLEEQVKAE